MERGSTKRHRGIRSIAVVGALGVAIAITANPSAADHGVPHAEVLTRNTFTDDVAAQFRVKLDGQRTLVRNLNDASDAVVLRITIQDGVVAPWHTHSGPGVLLNTGPGTLTSVLSDDCVARDYPPGTALIDPGQGSLHWATNNSGEDVVLIALFLGVAGGPVIPADPPAECSP
jgi:quercetin dioxygenase-like cupin family protein